ncbi:phosphopantothenoylcysteine decarboxylase/phosphopantothenate--cysteine ligase [Paenibacillus jamilae]|jgi:phosphopantothenoylcysteine decarboxylase/phosphopantothenate--cysteine ligase|uniref:bifunctional phosphopantothenoylcysteine decarboxylase/phosphopantothenate--cysteine ligase CoaBC n=1 Tax=Paenibacillus TaxID=44249 RepID=UPI000D2F7796|nr:MULTISPECIES: bifunctional phosphopantothenoylcysteine decarboxylase/phosphopantothenate--cysteine ligase CoaBC [Paenibacillus]MDP9674713.1 phosphopantothenoylcysteine decarboxylase/phosphopantothenate--cysteine ligase [Paenibacillus jamilae]KAF6620115.1 bifunctional phosphopantothenoylcysteine decarboxylase/phosphopantothenate--cysteine ligase CoaBC [Paenibacillus sp. EKM101P]KAF6623107.1 bifunctional phosphopantothenoylcysteine decarboxylase/phosphopantothenate--cysteine ligase CoaBC [Paeni
MLKGKVIILGITGGIAAYKGAALCSKLTQKGADVHVIMTASAKEFITELTLQSLSRNPVYSDTFDEREPSIVSHIHLADAADLVLVAPATANIIGKMAHGLADDMLSTTLLATTAPIMVAPAMNVHMYTHPAVMQNMETLVSRGVKMIEPGEGLLACGYVGKGRLEEPETIVQTIERFFDQQAQEPEATIKSEARWFGEESTEKQVTERLVDKNELALSGKKVIVTAGGTIERIDPVRYITNDSSGKMGFAIAKVAQEMGAEVHLIAANTSAEPPSGISLERVQSAENMYQAVLKQWETSDMVVMAAAVADYRPREVAQTKIKKKDSVFTLELVKNVDILESLGRSKKHQFLIGFAAETGNLETYAIDKLERKNCDLLAANDVTVDGAGFGVDTNAVQIYDRSGMVEQIPVQSKEEVARKLLTLAAGRMGGVLH